MICCLNYYQDFVSANTHSEDLGAIDVTFGTDLSIRVCSMFQQGVNNFMSSSFVHGSLPSPAFSIAFSSPLKKQLSVGLAPRLGGNVEGCVALKVDSLDIGSVIQEETGGHRA